MGNEARKAVYAANSGLFSGYRRIETLDSRTCVVCGLADQKIYKTLDEAPTLPQHPNCRGLYLPVIKGLEEWEADDERASVDGPVPAKTTWRDWLSKQPDDVVRDILGPARYEIYKMGTPISSFVVDGKTLNLQQLMDKEGLIKIPNSVGAMATRIYVKKPFSMKDHKYHLKEGTYITNITTIAEGEKIRDVKRLIREHPLQNGKLTNADDWYKVKGIGTVVNDSQEFTAELHWYQCKEIGKVEWKIKE
jgi:hypothetical protein